MKNLLLALFAFIFFSSCQSTQDLSSGAKIISVGKKELSFETISTLIEAKALSYQDPEGAGTLTVVGFPLNTFLDIFMGETWKDMDAILITSRDGNKIDIPVVRILKYRPLLAFRFANATLPFQKYAPFALVWDNNKYRELLKKGSKDWPVQITRLDAGHYSSQYASLFFNPASKK